MELIGISGILKGIKEMLVVNSNDTLELLKTRMACSVSTLDGVIKEVDKKEKEVTMSIESPTDLPPLPPPERKPVEKDKVPLDAGATAAKDDLLHGE